MVGTSPPELLGLASPFIAALALAVQTLSIRVGTSESRSEEALFIVLLVNVLLIVPAVAIWYYPRYGLTTKATLAFGVAGLAGMMAGRAFHFEGIKRIGASRAEPVKSATPLLASLAAVVILGESLTLMHLLGILLVVGGVGFITWETSGGSGGPGRASAAGLVFPAIAAGCFALEPIFVKIGFEQGAPVFVGVALVTVSATAGFLVYLSAVGRLPSSRAFSRASLGWYVCAGVASSVAIAGYFAGLQVAPVVYVAPILQTSPLFVFGLSYALLPNHERVTAVLVFGSLLILGGAALVILYA